MADLRYGQGGFDAASQESYEGGGYVPLPDGVYTAMMVESGVKSTASGNGDYLYTKWKVISGQYEGATLWSNINLWHAKQQVRSIAEREMGDICKAVGVMSPRDSVELHGKPALLTVALVDRTDKPGAKSNVIKSYATINSGGTRQQAQKSNPGTGSPQDQQVPWRK